MELSAGMNYLTIIQCIIYYCVRKYYFYLLNVLIYLLFVTFNVITSNIKNDIFRNVAQNPSSVLVGRVRSEVLLPTTQSVHKADYDISPNGNFVTVKCFSYRMLIIRHNNQ